MAHTQNPDFVLRRNGRVHLNRRGRQFSRLLAAEVCASAVVMLDTPRSEVQWRVLATHSIRQFPLHFSSRVSPCAVTFQLDSTISWSSFCPERRKAGENRQAIGTCLQSAACLSNPAVVYYHLIPLECLSRIKQIRSKQEVFSRYSKKIELKVEDRRVSRHRRIRSTIIQWGVLQRTNIFYQ
jgi:hypothetical protein